MALQQDTIAAAEYDRNLRQLMHECLPGILVGIIEQRPTDPIFHLARSLYTYMGKELPAQYKHQRASIIKPTANSMTTRQASSVYHIVGETATNQDEPVDFIDDVATAADITNTMVHEQMDSVNQTIGDVFDDDDIS